MSETVIESVPLHEYPEYRDGCIEVLCEEWGRSKSSRISMLEKSNPNFPYNIVLLERHASDGNQAKVIGHSRLCRVYGQPQAAFVESVVIRKKRRNEGLGRKLMEETEQHASRLGIQALYLSTHDKQDFYNHIGYEYCSPVLSSGAASAFLTEKLLLLVGYSETPPVQRNSCQKTETTLTVESVVSENPPSPEIDDNADRDDISEAPSESENISMDDDLESQGRHRIPSTHPPPPPPPTPLPGRAFNCDRKDVVTKISVYWMKKCLSSIS